MGFRNQDQICTNFTPSPIIGRPGTRGPVPHPPRPHRNLRPLPGNLPRFPAAGDAHRFAADPIYSPGEASEVDRCSRSRGAATGGLWINAARSSSGTGLTILTPSALSLILPPELRQPAACAHKVNSYGRAEGRPQDYESADTRRRRLRGRRPRNLSID